MFVSHLGEVREGSILFQFLIHPGFEGNGSCSSFVRRNFKVLNRADVPGIGRAEATAESKRVS